MFAPSAPALRAIFHHTRCAIIGKVEGGLWRCRYNEGNKVAGSLLLGLYDDDRLLHHVGFTSTINQPKIAPDPFDSPHATNLRVAIFGHRLLVGVLHHRAISEHPIKLQRTIGGGHTFKLLRREPT